jgi:ketosteroid isomerase-like protein
VSFVDALDIRKRVLLAATVFLACSFSVAYDQKDVDDVLKAEHTLCKAFEQGDLAYIKAHESDDYTLTNSTGDITTRQDDLDDFTKRHAHWTTFENRDMKVRVYGHETAVVIGKTFVKGTFDGKPVDIAVLFTDTFAKMNGEWILVAGHVTRIKN